MLGRIYQRPQINAIALTGQFEQIQISAGVKRWLLTTIRHYSRLFATVRHYSHYSRIFADVIVYIFLH